MFGRRRRINVIELHGLIASRVGSLNVGVVGAAIDKAFSTTHGKPVLLDIESPGGSPVQSDLIATRIRRRAEQAKVEVRAVIGDVGASGGYWIACAADRIYANPMSLVGSIGVRGGGFGFSELLTRVGVERRLYTAGAHKARLDPFLPEQADDVAYAHALLETLHLRFKAWVEERRRGKLNKEDENLFDGSAVLGEQGMTLGLIDAFGDVDGLVHELGGPRAQAHVFRPRRRGLLRRLPRIAADSLFDALDERLYFDRLVR